MASKSRQATLSLLAIALAGTANADMHQSFLWGFKTFTSESLPECGRLQIFIETSGMSTPAQPPYTLIAYESAGIPTRQLVGSDLNDLWWTVDHAPQSQLAISMADSAGNAGGVGGQIYTVVPSSFGAACHANNPISPVSITTNTTKAITSCEVLPLKISGGTKPYTITVAALGASVVTNFTLGTAFDTYNWVNRASPDSQILASVSDAQGIYAASTNLLSTSGSTDLTCGNRPSTEVDSTGQASALQSGTSAATSTSGASSGSNSGGSSSSPSTTTIIASVVGGVVLIGALVIGAFFFLRRRRANTHRPRTYGFDGGYNGFGLGKVGGPVPGQNVPFSNTSEEVTPFVMSGAQATPYTDNPPYQHSTYQSRYSTTASEATLGPTLQTRPSTYSVTSTISSGVLPYAVQQNLGSNAVMSPPPSSVSSFDPYGLYATGSITPSSPSESTGPSTAKPFAGAVYAARAGSAAGSAEAGSSSARFAVANPSPSDEKVGTEPPQPRESVYQHEDISDVTELPPAYKERTDH